MQVSRLRRQFVKADAVNRTSPEEMKMFDFGIGNQVYDEDIALGEAIESYSTFKVYKYKLNLL